MKHLSLSIITVFSIALPASALALSPMACTMDAKLCPDGVTYVGRDGFNNCEFQKCPGENKCSPYVCQDGTHIERCTPDGTVINYFAPPCMTHGGEVTDPYLVLKTASYDSRTKDLTLHLCNNGARKYMENEFGSLSFVITINGLTDHFAYSERGIAVGECPDLVFSDAFSHFSGQGGIPAGHYGVTVSLDNAPADHGSVYLNATIESGDVPPSANQSFSDVPGWHPNAVAIDYVKGKHMVSGYPDGTFRPDQTINRAEFTKIVTIARYNQFMIDGCRDLSSFSDVRVDEWHAKYICAARDGGLLTGYPDGTFRPAHTINFVEAAKILANGYRLIQRTEHCNGQICPDVDTPEHPWFEQYVRALATQHAIPVSITRFDQPITRGEMAEMIYRLHADVTNTATQTYEQLQTQAQASGTTGLSQEKIYTYQGTELTFRVPAEWPREKQVGPVNSDGGKPYVPSLWRLNLGEVCRGCAEGADAYNFTIDAYTSDPSLPNALKSDSLISILSDTSDGNIRKIVYTEGGICGYKNALFVTGNVDYKFTGRCADDAPGLGADFDRILATIIVTN